MAYWFQGLFALTDDEMLASDIGRKVHDIWPDAIYRYIREPFHGAGISRTPDALASHVEPDMLDEQIGPWTRHFPELTIVRIEAVCFGGACEYGGTVWRNGELLWQEERDQPGVSSLIRLLRYLGVTSDTGYFEPFTRNYFNVPDEPSSGQRY